MFKVFREFFGLEGNSILLVCGDSGVGKTLFGFELLREVGGLRCGVYVSCGIDHGFIASRYGNLGECLFDVVDANDFPFPREDDVYESVLSSKLPNLLRYIYEKVKGVKNAFIFVDGFEGICDAMSLDPVSTMDIYVAFLRRTGLRSVVTVRDEGELGRIVDGIVELNAKLINGRIVRKLFFKKLSGAKLPTPYFIYTLLGGRFSPLEHSLEHVKGLPDSILSKVKGVALEAGSRIGVLGERSLSFGSEDFDRFLGGLARYDFNLFIFDAKIPSLVRSFILISIVNRFVTDGGEVALIGVEPFLKLSDTLCSAFRVDEEKTFPLSIDENDIDKLVRAIKELMDSAAPSFLVLIDVDYLVAMFGYRHVIRFIHSLKNEKKLCVVGICSSAPTSLQGIAGRVFSFSEEGEYIFVYGIKPWTPLYLLSVDLTYDGFIKLSLTELV